MTNIFTPFAGTADALAATLFPNPSGVALVAASTFDSLLLGNALIEDPGILLTTGDGTPPLENTRKIYGVPLGQLGDEELTGVAQDAFDGAGTTFDAASLKFKVKADPGVKSVMLDIVFGSDEFPEYSSTSFVDIAAIFVNGKNVALFNGNASQPLSVLDDNLGYFQDNRKGGIAIEYDGVSNKLTLIAPVEKGGNTIKIAIGDTQDSATDSAIFIANIRGSSLDVSGLLNEIAGTDGKDKLKADAGIDNVVIGGLGTDKLIANTGFDVLFGDLEEEDVPIQSTTLDAAPTDAKDIFVFKAVDALAVRVDATDVVADFDDLDRIDISRILKKTFDYVGKEVFSADGDPEVRYKLFKKKDYTGVYGDTDGDGKADFTVKVLGLHKFTGDDFLL
jgi:hypothetical protein